MADRPNWYSETGPERRARRHQRFHSARIWLILIGIVLAVFLYMGGPFVHGSQCSSGATTNAAGISTYRTECHEVRGWRP